MLLKELRNNLDDAMNKYNTLMEREVLKLNYGWDISSMGFNEIAELYNVDVKLISKTKNRALNKLRACKYIKANKINFVNDGLIDCSRFYI